MKQVYKPKRLAAVSGKPKHERFVRVLSLFLAVVLLQGAVTVPVYSAESEKESTGASAQTSAPETSVQEETEAELPVDEETLKITLDGTETTVLELFEYEKVEIRAEGLAEKADYQWQILHPEQEGLWVDIYDATEQSLSVTAALVNNMINEDGTAALRCRAYTADYAYLADSIRVTLLNETEAASAQLFSLDDPAVPLAEGDATPEFVTVTITYELYSYVENANGVLEKQHVNQAFTPYIATLKSGTDLETSVHSPTIVGYTPYLVEKDSDGNSVLVDGASVEISETAIQSDIEYEVQYHPSVVSYDVRYYFQNIYDDLYVEDSKIQSVVHAMGETGTKPDPTYTKAEFEGFTSLYYEPETIAADGSTVFNVYYERNYYLMEFDCNEGFGTDTIYVRYGTYISVPNPERPGWVFQGWDLVKCEQDPQPTLSDGQQDILPETMPHYNSAYKALWTTTDTTYTEAYWLDNGDGTYTYIGTRHIDAESNSIVSGVDYLLGDQFTGFRYVCGKAEYTHTDSCYICGAAGHAHTTSCYTCSTAEHTHRIDICTLDCNHTHSAGCCSNYGTQNPSTNDQAAFANIGDGEPESGYVYTINATGDGNTYYYLYVDGTWYYLLNDSTWVAGEQLGSTGYYTNNNGTTWEAKKYNVNLACGHIHSDECVECTIAEHTHGADCHKCGLEEHSHSVACEVAEATPMEFVKADEGILVKGDGSTVVNVYYTYKTYTLKFYYAKEENGNYYVAGGSTWAFSGSDNDVAQQFAALASNVWGQVKSLPTINSTQYTTGSDEYTVNGVTGKYHYLQFSAKYGSDISTIWPVGIFDRVQTASTFEFGDYAYFSAWNVDANTWYDETYENKTLKGNYQRLDYQMLIHENYTDRDTIHFLAFWENGANGIGWNKPHKWIYNVYVPTVEGTTAYDHIYNGVRYDLYGQYTLYDDNSNESDKPYCGQTPTALEGYKYLAHEVKFVEEYDSTYQLNTYQIDFYYSATMYELSFYNHNNFISDIDIAIDGKQAKVEVPYATELSSYMALADSLRTYPDTLEPNAYRFAGWYTTPDCLTNSEFGQFHYDAEGNYAYAKYEELAMPAGNLTLYAKWEPVKRNVYFYYLYSDIAKNDTWETTDLNGKEISYPIVVNHGALLGTTYAFTPTRVENGKEYTFVGWFYMDENNKKRFAPDTMEIRQDLHLFAEWQSSIDTQYKVTYVLKEEAKVGDTVYDAGTIVAEPAEGHLTAGKTKTFNAKAGAELLSTFADASLFPDTNSHSILMSEDSSANTFEFQYVVDDQVWYKIKYLDKSDNSVLHEEYVDWTNKAVITPKFEPIRGYIPDQYYIRKVLASDGATGDRNNVLPENEIIFYYTKDEDHGLYTILYYTENLDGTWYQDQSELGSDDLTTNGSPTVISRNIPTDKYDGFTYDHAEVITYTYDADKDEYISSTKEYDIDDGTTVTGELSAGGLEIRIYYKRNSYPYVIKLMQYGTKNILGYGKLGDSNLYTPDEIKTAVALFGSTISYTAPETINLGDYTYILVSESPQSKKIRVETGAYENLQYNQLTFYYDVKKTTVQYEARCTVSDAEGFGKVSINQESAAMASNLSGASAMPGSGFEFVGWYNAETGVKVEADGWVIGPDENGYYKLKPKDFSGDTDDDGVIKYYALFKPILTRLTITKQVKESADAIGTIATNDTFLFSVKGTGKHKYIDLTVAIKATTGNDSVVITELPIDTYEVTELTAWSWEYTQNDVTPADGTITVGTDADQNIVTFANTYNESDWLNGECAKENDFN